MQEEYKNFWEWKGVVRKLKKKLVMNEEHSAPIATDTGNLP